MGQISNEEKNLEIVMFNMSSYVEWQKGVDNRNRHVFNRLLERPEVARIIVIDFLPFTFKRTARNYWQNVIRKLKAEPGRGGKSKVIYRDLTTRCVKIDGKRAELYVFSTIDSVFSHKRVIKKLNKVLDKIGGQAISRVIWSCFPMFVDYFDKVKADLTVFDAVDNWIEHPSFKKHKGILEKNYQIIVGKSDLIFTVSENLLDFFRNLGREKDIYWIANGVEVSHFTGPEPGRPKDMEKIPRPIIGYVGIIQQRLDIDLLEYLAEKNPEKSIVLIGPVWPVYFRKLRKPAVEIQRLRKHKNVYLLGPRSYQLTPAYIRNFDLAISPHRLDNFIKYTSSLKVLEYLICGKPVVTAPSSSVEKFSHLVYIARDYQDFDRKIKKALESDNRELKEERIRQISNYDWGLKTKEMIKLIKDKLL